MLPKLLTGKLTFTSLKPLDLSACTKRQIIEYFENTYDLTESLFTSLKDVSVFYKCPDRLRLPLIFYFGHTAVVYINKMILADLIQERVNLDMETIFETGVDEMSWDDTENYRMGGAYMWPHLEDVIEYRRQVRQLMINTIEDTPLEMPVTMDSPWWAIFMGMEHERIHLETSSVLIRQLPVDMVTKPSDWIYGPFKHDDGIKTNPLVRVDGGDVAMGKPWDFPSYGWDNEYGEYQCHVPSFEATKCPITNRDFMPFVESGGYDNKDIWTDEGWQWRQFRQVRHPVFWVCEKGCRSGCGANLSNYSHCGPEVSTNKNNKIKKETFRFRVMFDVLMMPFDWPVEVNYHEANAYCKWKGQGYRLLTEAEHNVIRGEQMDVSGGVISDVIYQEKMNSNLNMVYGSSTPVNMFPTNDRGFHDACGNVWQWTEDHFNGLDGYNSHWLYDDFSSPCFDGRHNIILGGSWISTGDEASRFARYAFRRHFIQHAGFRMARSLSEIIEDKVTVRNVGTEIYARGCGFVENPSTVDEAAVKIEYSPSANIQLDYANKSALAGILALEFGYRDSFSAMVSRLCCNYARLYNCTTDSAMHVGAGFGRGPMEFSKLFKSVLAIDYCGQMVDAGETMIGKIDGLKMENLLKINEFQKTISVDEEYNPQNIVFKQLTWLPNEVGSHDFVLISFLDRALHPKAWLVRLHEVTKKQGIAVIASSDGAWDHAELKRVIGKKLRCICRQEVPYTGAQGLTSAMVTAWKHRGC